MKHAKLTGIKMNSSESKSELSCLFLIFLASSAMLGACIYIIIRELME